MPQPSPLDDMPHIHGAVFRGDTLHLFPDAESMQEAVDGPEWSCSQRYTKVIVHKPAKDLPPCPAPRPPSRSWAARSAGIGMGRVIDVIDEDTFLLQLPNGTVTRVRRDAYEPTPADLREADGGDYDDDIDPCPWCGSESHPCDCVLGEKDRADP